VSVRKTIFNLYTDPESQKNYTPCNARAEVMHQNKQASKADFRLKLLVRSAISQKQLGFSSEMPPYESGQLYYECPQMFTFVRRHIINCNRSFCACHFSTCGCQYWWGYQLFQLVIDITESSKLSMVDKAPFPGRSYWVQSCLVTAAGRTNVTHVSMSRMRFSINQSINLDCYSGLSSKNYR